MNKCFAHTSVRIPHAHMVPMDPSKGLWIPWNWGHGWLLAYDVGAGSKGSPGY